MHRALDVCTSSVDPLAARRIAVIVPTRGAGESLRRTLEALRFDTAGRSVFVAPEILTRADLYARLHEHLPGAPPMLSEFEREVLFKRLARVASDSGAEAPDRKSTRLNSSHSQISYAVFCLKKKKKKK